MILTSENIFLIILAIVWIIGAILQDLKRREVDNIWNFSLISIALAYRLSLSVFSGNYWLITNGILGLMIFVILGNTFYYSRIFAGGDAKLMIALGTILPFSLNWIINFKIFGYFILLFLFGGSIYVLIWSIFLVIFNYKKFSREFIRQFKSNINLFIISFILAFLLLILFIAIKIKLIYISLIIISYPLLYIFAKSIEESCMVKLIKPEKVTVGDWLYEDIIVNGRKIKASWDGVSKNQLLLIQKKYKRKILIKQGIPFTPGFLIGFLGLLWIDFISLL